MRALQQSEQALRHVVEQRKALEDSQPKDAAAGILAESGGPAAASTYQLGLASGELKIQVALRQSRLPTGIVHLLDRRTTPLVSYHLHYEGFEQARLRLTSFVEGYSARAIDSLTLSPENPDADISHLPTFFPAQLAQVTELTRATLHTQVDDLDGKTQHQRTDPIWLLARSSAYNGIRDPLTGAWIELWEYLAAWVTPGAEEVLNVLRKAAAQHPQKRLAGYVENVQGVQEQVKAIYNALKAEQIAYVNTTLAFGAGEGEAIQRVRLPKEALKTRSANCIDSSVLVASLLEAASLNPAIVILPGHALIAWETQPGSGEWDYLETTLLAAADFEAAQAAGREALRRNQELVGGRRGALQAAGDRRAARQKADHADGVIPYGSRVLTGARRRSHRPGAVQVFLDGRPDLGVFVGVVVFQCALVVVNGALQVFVRRAARALAEGGGQGQVHISPGFRIVLARVNLQRFQVIGDGLFDVLAGVAALAVEPGPRQRLIDRSPLVGIGFARVDLQGALVMLEGQVQVVVFLAAQALPVGCRQVALDAGPLERRFLRRIDFQCLFEVQNGRVDLALALATRAVAQGGRQVVLPRWPTGWDIP